MEIEQQMTTDKETGDKILLAHGSGGKLAHQLVNDCFIKPLSGPILDQLEDSATIDLSGKTAFTTDSYVVTPIFFPGGDIGKLSVCGTINDLAMSGALPRYISLAVIIEEGLPKDQLEKIVESIKRTTAESEVAVVTGDTKVVNNKSADKIYINTAGIGQIPSGVKLSSKNLEPGDKVIVSGTIGDHGIAIMSVREGLQFSTTLRSDCAPLAKMVRNIIHSSPNIRALRDPTRGGLATTLNELAQASRTRILIDEEKIPVRDEVNAACEMLGLDPLYVANEGKLICVVSSNDAESVLEAIRASRYGENAAIVGEVTSGPPGRVVMRTTIGSSRIVDMLTGDILPRIC